MIDGIIGYNCERKHFKKMILATLVEIGPMISQEKMVEKVYNNRRRTLRDGQRSRSTSGENSVYISHCLVLLPLLF